MASNEENAGEIRERLKIQLVSTVGPFGTNRGCPFAQTKREFAKDWSESLEDYARSLGYRPTNDGVLKMMADLSDVVRLVSTNGETRVHAINNQKLSHCFWLIDRTRKRRLSRGSARRKSQTRSRGRHNSESGTVCFNCWKTGHLGRDCSERHTKPTCFSCGARGHFSRECTQSSSRLCYNCSEPGHISQDCPKKKPQFLQLKDVKATQAIKNTDEDPNAGWLACENCYAIGHLSQECPQKQHHRLQLKDVKAAPNGRLCYNCAEPGHICQDCPKKKPQLLQLKDVKATQPIKNSAEDPNAGWLECKNCCAIGHLSRECPQKQHHFLQLKDVKATQVIKHKAEDPNAGWLECENCYAIGHLSRECKQKQHHLLQLKDVKVSQNIKNTDEDPNAGWLECKNCYIIGHLSRECPKKQHHLLQLKDVKSTQAIKQNAEDPNAGWLECENCYAIGHLSRECPQKQHHLLQIPDDRASRNSRKQNSMIQRVNSNKGKNCHEEEDDEDYKAIKNMKISMAKITLTDPDNRFSNSALWPPIYLRLNVADDWTGKVERSADKSVLYRILGHNSRAQVF